MSDVRKKIASSLNAEFKADPLEMQNRVTLCYDRITGKPIEMYEEDRFLHTLIVGPSGTGKSSQILLPLIYQDIINEDCGVVIFDPKEDLAKDAYELASKYSPRKVVYIDPISENCPKINPFAGTKDEVINTLSKIFTSGVTHGAGEQLMINSARLLIVRSITLISNFPQLVGNNLNIKTYSDFINNRGNVARMECVKIKEQLQREKKSPDLQDICDWFNRVYFETSSKTNENCYNFRQQMEEIASNEFLSRVLSPSDYDKNIVNFNESIAAGDVVIINTRYSYLGSMAKVFGEFMLQCYMVAAFKRRHYQEEHNLGEFLKPNFLYIDEFATFSLVSTDLFTQGRSFRIGVHICVQSRALLRVCGDQDSTEQATVVEANTRNLILFPGMEGTDAAYYSSQFFNLTPQQILYRPFGQIVYRIVQKRTILPPNIGLVFFVDEEPNTRSIENEFSFDKNGQLIHKDEKTEEEKEKDMIELEGYEKLLDAEEEDIVFSNRRASVRFKNMIAEEDNKPMEFESKTELEPELELETEDSSESYNASQSSEPQESEEENDEEARKMAEMLKKGRLKFL